MSKNGKKTKAGFVYILENAEMPGMIKIGESIDAEKRAEELSKPSGVVGAYEVFWKHKIEDDNQAVEKALHYKFREFASNKEFFRIDKNLAKKEAIKLIKAIAPVKNPEAEVIKDAQSTKAPKHRVIQARRLLWEMRMPKNKHAFIRDAVKMCLKEDRVGEPSRDRFSAIRSNGFTQIGRIDLYVLKEHLRLVVTTKNSENARMIIRNMIGKHVEIKSWEGGVSFFIRDKEEYSYLKSWLSLGKRPAKV